MGKKIVASGILFAAMAIALTSGVSALEAQSASDFVGKWTITFAPPAGGGFAGAPGGGGGAGGGGGMRGGPTVLDVTLNAGTLAATMTGGMGRGMGGGGGAGGGAAAAAPRPREISDVKLVNGALVLTYSVNMQGQASPVTLTLTRDGATTKANMDMGAFQRTGTATKE